MKLESIQANLTFKKINMFLYFNAFIRHSWILSFICLNISGVGNFSKSHVLPATFTRN